SSEMPGHFTQQNLEDSMFDLEGFNLKRDARPLHTSDVPPQTVRHCVFQSQARCQATSHHTKVSTDAMLFGSFNLKRDARPLHTSELPPTTVRHSMFQSQARCQATSHHTKVSTDAMLFGSFNLKRDARPLHTMYVDRNTWHTFNVSISSEMPGHF